MQIIETAVLSTKVINETRFQLYHTDEDQLANSLLPGVTVGGAFNGGGAQVGRSTDTENHYELQNYTTVSGGAHTWKFGVRVRAVTINNVSPQNFGGSYFFNTTYAPILDANNQPVAPGVTCDPTNPNPTDCTQLTSIQVYSRTLALQQLGLNPFAIQQLGAGPSQFTITQGVPLVNVNQVDLGAFLGDDWRVKPNLTLSLGMRFETQTNIHDWHDWAPRLGLRGRPARARTIRGPRRSFEAALAFFTTA